jgi:hypothetical protein
MGSMNHHEYSLTHDWFYVLSGIVRKSWRGLLAPPNVGSGGKEGKRICLRNPPYTQTWTAVYAVSSLNTKETDLPVCNNTSSPRGDDQD